MAVEQSQPRIICNEIDFSCAEGIHQYHILMHPSGELASEVGDLKGVAVKMQRMSVAALVAEDHPIPLPLADNEGIGIGK